MKATGIVRRFDDLGRIVIPKDLRRQLFGTKNSEGMPMEIFMDKDNIILRKYEENKTVDVCEWELDGDNLITGCGDYFNTYDNCTDKFKYCPRCGKKIKAGGTDAEH